MALTPISTTRPTGLDLFAFPDGASLATWLANRVYLTEGTGANAGRYTASLDDSIDILWRLFEGDDQPASWSASIEYFNLKSAATFIVTPSVGQGDYDVTTRELTLPIDAEYTIVRVVVDSAGDQITLPPGCIFHLTDANEVHLADLTPTITGAAYTVVIPRNLTTQQRTINFAFRDPTTNFALDYGTIQFIYAAV
jgi:hypothetical protein